MTDAITKEILTEKLDMIQDCNLGNLDFQMGAEYVCGVLRQWANLEAYKPLKDASIEEEITNYFHDFWPGTETAEQCNTDLHFTPLAILRLAEHFAKWGADHFRDATKKITINDLELLHTFLYAVKNNKSGVFTFTRLTDEQYQEVLNRFAEHLNK